MDQCRLSNPRNQSSRLNVWHQVCISEKAPCHLFTRTHPTGPPSFTCCYSFNLWLYLDCTYSIHPHMAFLSHSTQPDCCLSLSPCSGCALCGNALPAPASLLRELKYTLQTQFRCYSIQESASDFTGVDTL